MQRGDADVDRRRPRSSAIVGGIALRDRLVPDLGDRQRDTSALIDKLAEAIGIDLRNIRGGLPARSGSGSVIGWDGE